MKVRVAFSIALAFVWLSCSDDRVAGTSSGVDNPAITVGFADPKGAPAKVTGDLDVYAADQNPAVDAEPLATIKVKNASLTLVTAEDFNRARQSATKRSAAAGTGQPGGRVFFNLLFRHQDGKKGAIALGLAYDPAARAFSRSDGSVRSVTFVPKSLIRYAGGIAREPVHGKDCRVFVPGTPFLAALVDSQFTLEALPQGRLPLGLIGEDGRIYPIADSLNTADSGKVYRPSASPSGSLDSAGSNDTLPDFQVIAPEPHVAGADDTDFLEARLAGLSPHDPRMSVLWKWLPDSAPKADTPAPPGPAAPPPAPAVSAEILQPTSLRTGIRFHGDAVFRFRISVTVGTRTRSDTAVVSVYHPPPVEPAIIHPAPAESLTLGTAYTVQWRMPGQGPYDIDVSLDLGTSWIPLEKAYVPPQGVQAYAWTPSPGLGPSGHCLLRVLASADTAQRALTAAPFSLIP